MASVDDFRSLQGATDETFTHVCAPCDYSGSQKEATHYCNDCQELLCGSCTDYHKGLRMSRNHKVVSVKDLPKQTETKSASSCIVLCSCDQNLGVTEYCDDHDDVICQACKTLKHRKCKTSSISEKSTSYKKEKLNLIALNTKSTKEEIDKYIQGRNVDLQNLVSAKQKCKNDISAFRKDLNTILDLLEHDTLAELGELESMEKREIEQQLLTLSTTKRMFQTDDNLLQNAKNSQAKSDMFAADVKISKRLKEYETLLHDIRQEIKSPVITFMRNNELADMKTKVTRLGSLAVNYSQDQKLKSCLFLDLKVKSNSRVVIKLPEDKTIPCITVCTFMQDGRLVMCDYYRLKIEMLSSTFAVQDILGLQTRPWDVSVIDSSNIIITLPEKKLLQYIEVVPRLKTGRVIQLDKMCWGIDVVGQEIYVTCCNNPGEGELRILHTNGSMKRRIGVNQDGSFMFQQPRYLSVNAASKKIYVSDWYTPTVTCLMSDGSVVYHYKDQDLIWPTGVCVDDEDNIIVCGYHSHNVQVVTAEGNKRSTLFTSKDGISYPYSVAYRHSDGTMIVVCQGQNLLTYKTAK